jgi:hypothetical protein
MKVSIISHFDLGRIICVNMYSIYSLTTVQFLVTFQKKEKRRQILLAEFPNQAASHLHGQAALKASEKILSEF